ncbi:MAG: hypothetical protein R6V15_10935, partial [Desulfotignum sp.]
NTLQSPRIKTLGARILARNYNMTAPPEFENHIHRLTASEGQIKGYRSDDKYTLSRAMSHLGQMQADASRLGERQRAALGHIKAYLDTLAV